MTYIIKHFCKNNKFFFVYKLEKNNSGKRRIPKKNFFLRLLY